MSYIAFDLDAINVAPAVARAAGVAENDVLGGLARLWAWCFRQHTDQVSSLQLRGHFGVDVSPALVAFGFLEEAPKGYRVKGAERYLAVSEKRAAAGRARAAAAGRRAGKFSSKAPAPTSTAPASDQQNASTPPGLHLAPSTKHLTPKGKDSAGEAPAADGDAWKRLVAEVAAVAPSYAFTGRDFKALKACQALAKGDAAEVVTRWRRALAADGYPRVRALHELERTWNHWATAGVANTRSPVAAESVDWTNAQEGEIAL